ncbi:kinase-like protein [Clavulina sp. PMI_390]|nr:kinase-like protein [Clavulina sp. PMI_390]
MIVRLSLDPIDLSNITQPTATRLLDLVNAELRKRSFDHPRTLKLLQDLCGHFLALPSAFIMKDVSFDRKDVVGRGGEAIVYHGYMVEGNQPVVVREVVMPTKEWKSPSGRKLIRLVHREAITHSQLDHPNILPFLGIYHEEVDSPPITVLPFMERGSLQDLLAGAALDPGAFKCILIGVGSGVDYLHSRRPPIIHGDLHPGNVLIDSAGNPCLCDFGLSRIRHEVTRTRTILQEAGRLRFLAPELSAGWTKRFRTSCASDIFSLAMTYLNTWSGQPPFSELRNDLKVASNFRKGRRPNIPSTGVLLPLDSVQLLWKLLSEMWAPRPEDRPSSSTVCAHLNGSFTIRPHMPSSFSSASHDYRSISPGENRDEYSQPQSPPSTHVISSMRMHTTRGHLPHQENSHSLIRHVAPLVEQQHSTSGFPQSPLSQVHPLPGPPPRASMQGVVPPRPAAIETQLARQYEREVPSTMRNREQLASPFEYPSFGAQELPQLSEAGHSMVPETARGRDSETLSGNTINLSPRRDNVASYSAHPSSHATDYYPNGTIEMDDYHYTVAGSLVSMQQRQPASTTQHSAIDQSQRGNQVQTQSSTISQIQPHPTQPEKPHPIWAPRGRPRPPPRIPPDLLTPQTQQFISWYDALLSQPEVKPAPNSAPHLPPS